jgi:cytochrome d ubiquinol oxidase subunit I
MQHPVGAKVTDGTAQLTSVSALITNRFAVWAFFHTLLVGLTTGATLVLGVACWHLVHGSHPTLFRRASKLALVVLVPVAALNLGVGSYMGIVADDLQPMKISAAEALWNTQQPAAFSLFQIGGFTKSDPTPSFSIEVPGLLSWLATGSFDGKVEGLNQIQQQEAQAYGPGNYIPPVRTVYWSMRVMAYLGTIVLVVAALGAFLLWRGRLERTRWYLWAAVFTIPLPFLAALAGWVLTEVGRQPWIVQGLLRTADASSPSVSEWTIGASLAVFLTLYTALGVTDFVLMRRYARIDPAPTAPVDRTVPVPSL